ncbi:MAG: SigB/SigF/SigG family RNA polymerase sigma factor [Clostridia bacterium]
MEEFKLIDSNETLRLIALAQTGEEDAKEKLVNGNYPLIKSIVKRYRNKGTEYDDLYQLGCLGFLKAIRNFDTSYNVKFSTYAVPMIAGEIKRFLRDDGTIKVSRALKTLAIKVNSYIDKYKQEHNGAPTLEQLGTEFDCEPQEIVFALDAMRAPISIYEHTDDRSESSPSIIDKIIVEEKEDMVLDKLLLKDAICELGDRERKILLLRYYRGKTQSEVAEILGVSQVQVSRLENKILDKLKEKFK